MTDADKQARRAADRDQLEQAARRLLTSQGWQDWIRVRAANGLARYSLRNQLLLAIQSDGTATFVAGFRAWLKLDRCVRKGEKALRILAPMTIRDKNADPTDPDARRVLFKTVPVFDIRQVDPLPDRQPPPLQPPSQPITGDSHQHLLAPLTALACELGYTVDVRPLDGPVGGWCDADRRQIVLDAGLPANGRVRVLVHELAHALGLGYAELGREQAEVLVDSVALWRCSPLLSLWLGAACVTAVTDVKQADRRAPARSTWFSRDPSRGASMSVRCRVRCGT